MKKRQGQVFLLFLFFIANCFMGCRTYPVSNITPVKDFDIERYAGKWYEIARMDFMFERNMSNVTAEYTMNEDGTVKVVNRGYNYIQHKWKKAEGKAKQKGNAEEGALKVSFFGPIYNDYIVLALDESYTYALVGGKNYDYLWILSRTSSIPESIKKHYIAMAKSLGYPTEYLIWTVHNTK